MKKKILLLLALTLVLTACTKTPNVPISSDKPVKSEVTADGIEKTNEAEDTKFEPIKFIGEDGYTYINGIDITNQDEEEYLAIFVLKTCEACIEYKKLLKEYEKEENSIPFYLIELSDNEENPRVAQELGIESVPTTVYVKGNIPVTAIAGAINKDEVKEFIEEASKMYESIVDSENTNSSIEVKSEN